jgi:COX assembly protein 1
LFLTNPLVSLSLVAFADCALGRTFTVPFACRKPHNAMNACMKAHATPAEQDAAREEWFAKRLERQTEKERKARRKMEQETFLREWWGLPEKDREERRREEEKLRMPERIGGMVRRREEDGGKEGGR